MIKIDSDTHFTPRDAYDQIDKKFAVIGPRLVEQANGRLVLEYPARAPFVPEHIKQIRRKGHAPEDLQAEPRIGAMASDGFAMQVLIPNNAPFYYDVDGELGASVSRSFNAAIGRILKRYPGRFIGVAPIPLQAPQLAIQEMDHAVKDLGLLGVMVYQNVNRKDLDDESLWPVYEHAQALGIPILVHGVDSGPLLGVERYARFNLDVCLGFPFEVFQAISALIFGGVVERFPKLKFGFFEVGVGFIPWFVDRLEMAYDARPAARARIPRRPADYFNNFYFSLGADDSTLAETVKRVGSKKFMIGSDYPHPDGTAPNTIKMVETIDGLTSQDKENLLGATAAEFFDLKI